MAKATAKKDAKTSKFSKPKKIDGKVVKAEADAPMKTGKASVSKASSAKSTSKVTKAPKIVETAIGKKELRHQLEKLAETNASLKTKGREIAKALKAAEARIASLEHEISQSKATAIIDAKPEPRGKAPNKARTPKPLAQPAPDMDRQEDGAATFEIQTS